MKKRLAAALALAVSHPAMADALSAGKKAAAEGDYAKAYAKWAKSDAPEAPYLIGFHASWGRIPNCDANCALSWLQKAVARDHIPAVTGIGELLYNDGQTEKGLAALTFAARWNDGYARQLLTSVSQPVPEPDLWNAYVERQRIAAEAAEKQRIANNQAAAVYAPALGNLVGCLVAGSACGRLGATPTYNRDHGMASLVSQQAIGYDRQCGYLTPSGMVTVIVKGMCPATYQY